MAASTAPKMRNIGPKSAAWLRQVGLRTEADLVAVGIVFHRFSGHSYPHRPGPIDGKVVVLVDDVLYSGRTVQAALAALADLGRPSAVQLVTLIDRGHRELPIQADIVGKQLPTARAERVRVRLSEIDGEDLVTLSRPDADPTERSAS